LTSRSRGQVYCGGDKPTGVVAPGTATSDWALEAAADGVCITIKHETASRIKDVLERAAADADLQYAAIKAALKIKVVAEAQLCGVAVNRNARRIEALVTYGIGIINERSIRHRIGRRKWISII
jgi:hypothetical protein